MDTMSAGGKDELQEWVHRLCHDARHRLSNDGGATSQEVLHAREELSAGVAALESERLEDIHLERFHSTPGHYSARSRRPCWTVCPEIVPWRTGESGAWSAQLPATPRSQTQMMRQQHPQTAQQLARQCRVGMTQTLMALCRRVRNFPAGTARQPPLRGQSCWIESESFWTDTTMRFSLITG